MAPKLSPGSGPVPPPSLRGSRDEDESESELESDGEPGEGGLDELLTHSAWLRRLALGLARGQADPEDLVQATYVTALRQPNRGDLPARRWLAQVLRNVWRMRLRSDVRRSARESEFVAATYPDGAPSSEALLEQVEGRKLLASLVDELDEPYRATVLARFHEGLSSAEIARRDGVPAGTVRWRLMTGLDRLREALDTKSGGDRGRWLLMLLPPIVAASWRAPAKASLALGAAGAAAICATVAGVSLWSPAAMEGGAPAAEERGGALEIRFMHALPAPASDPEQDAPEEKGPEPARAPRGAQPKPQEAPREEAPAQPSAPKEPGVVGGTVGGIVGGVLAPGSAPEPPARRVR